MGLAERDYMRRDYNSTRSRNFKSNTQESDSGRFSCIKCGRTYSTKEAAMACFRSHKTQFKDLKIKKDGSYKLPFSYKFKNMVKKVISNIFQFVWGIVKLIVIICIIRFLINAFFGFDLSEEANIDTSDLVPSSDAVTTLLNRSESNLPYYTECIPYSKASGKQVCLINYKNATDPTWDELLSFLKNDTTDEYTYSYSSFVCADYAEVLHNNAEASGIRAAWVSVDFAEGPGHALNAFNTTDRGLVYVDCTGEGFLPLVMASVSDTVNIIPNAECDYDKIAYITIGKEYGLISIDKATSSGYWFYEDYTKKWNEYERKLDGYNIEVEKYNRAVEAYEMDLKAYEEMLGGRTVIDDPTEYERLNKMYNELKRTEKELDLQYEKLQRQKEELDRLEEELGCSWEPLSIVTEIKIYW